VHYQMEMALSLLAALALGLMIGIERGWSGRDSEEGARVAGVRTFSLIGLSGGVFAILAQQWGVWLIITGFVVVAILIAASYISHSKLSDDAGITTEFSMLLTFALAIWGASGDPLPALSCGAVVVALLGHKKNLHKLLKRISPKAFYSGITLLLISVVVLPLLPDEGYGPWQALNPYWLWWMVVLISGLSFIGYLFTQLLGEKRGTLITAIAGGFASSTAVTLTMARFAKKNSHTAIYVSGTLLACSIMFPRVLIEVFVVNRALLGMLWPSVALMFVGLLVVMVIMYRQQKQQTHSNASDITINNPLQLGTAIQFGLLLAVILLLSEAMKQWFGDAGIYSLAIVSGLMDVDAITLSLSRSAQNELSPEVAVMGIILACASNTLLKGIMFASVAGIKLHYKYAAYMILAVVPGLLYAFWNVL